MAEWNATAIVVDDRSPSIYYSSGWQQVDGSPGPADTTEFQLTKTGASSAGQNASFVFAGTGVEVYGSQGSLDLYGRPSTLYTVDGLFNTTYQAPAIQPPLYTVHTLFYRSPPLPPGEHKLVITNLNGTSPNVYWLDYILYMPTNFTSISSSLGMQSSSIPVTAQFPPMPSFVNTDSSNSRTSERTGAIIGGVIGAVVFMAIVSLSIWLYHRKKASQMKSNSLEVATPWPLSQDPFSRRPTPHVNQNAFRTSLSCEGFTDATFPADQAPLPGRRSTSRASLVQGTEIASTLDRPSSGSAETPTKHGGLPVRSQNLSDRELVRRHQDSGLRFPVILDLPPEYNLS